MYMYISLQQISLENRVLVSEALIEHCLQQNISHNSTHVSFPTLRSDAVCPLLHVVLYQSRSSTFKSCAGSRESFGYRGRFEKTERKWRSMAVTNNFQIPQSRFPADLKTTIPQWTPPSPTIPYSDLYILLRTHACLWTSTRMFTGCQYPAQRLGVLT